LQDIPSSAGGDSSGAAVTNVPGTSNQPAAAAPSGGANSMGVEVLTPGVNGQAPAQNNQNGGLKPVGPTNTATPPPAEKPEAAPDAINDVSPSAQPAGQPTQAAATGKKKNPKPAFNDDEESSSTHKKKKGLKKINPF
jgi:outer membrane protein assembly factor BamD